jgi:hypothetical protein
MPSFEPGPIPDQLDRSKIVAAMACLLVLSGLALADDANPRPKGKNCDLTSPPPSAGEEMNQGVTVRIFPRAKDVTAKYSGCQVLFAPDGKKWVVVSLTEIVSGDPFRVWVPEDDPAMNCRYKLGKVVRGYPGKCPATEFLILKSVAPGCVEAIRDNAAKQGPGAPWPKQCEYQ